MDEPKYTLEDDSVNEDEIFSQMSSNHQKKDIPFWSENPNILLNPAHITELFPSEDMAYSQKLNAITRLVFLLTVVVYLLTHTFRSIVFGVLSLFAIYLVHYYHSLDKKKDAKKRDAFTGLDGQNEKNSPALKVLGKSADSVLVSPKEVFDNPSAENPFSNVLVTDITGNPNKKPAPPAYNDHTNQSILAAAKEAVMNANPGQPDISDKLFKDLGEQMSFEQSMRQFYSTPSTQTPDDQQAFAEFCYGSMISCAEGNKFACARNAAAMRHTMI
jgi:hypothetical protein